MARKLSKHRVTYAFFVLPWLFGFTAPRVVAQSTGLDVTVNEVPREAQLHKQGVWIFGAHAIPITNSLNYLLACNQGPTSCAPVETVEKGKFIEVVCFSSSHAYDDVLSKSL